MSNNFKVIIIVAIACFLTGCENKSNIGEIKSTLDSNNKVSMKMNTSYSEKFMQRAIELSETAYKTEKGLPVGCVIVKNDKIVGEGHNEIYDRKNPTAHAEMLAIQDACKNLNNLELKDCQLYTTVEPCPMCFGAIYWARLDAVYFANTKDDAIASGFEKSNILEELQKSPDNRLIPMRHLTNASAIKVLKDWQLKNTLNSQK